MSTWDEGTWRYFWFNSNNKIKTLLIQFLPWPYTDSVNRSLFVVELKRTAARHNIFNLDLVTTLTIFSINITIISFTNCGIEHFSTIKNQILTGIHQHHPFGYLPKMNHIRHRDYQLLRHRFASRHECRRWHNDVFYPFWFLHRLFYKYLIQLLQTPRNI